MRSWTWLTEPLTLDAANTRRWASESPAEFLNDPQDLNTWLDVVRSRLPRHQLDLPESFDEHDLAAFRNFRDVLIDILGPLSQSRAAPDREGANLRNGIRPKTVLTQATGAGLRSAAGPRRQLRADHHQERQRRLDEVVLSSYAKGSA